jgi:hypothetical protein
MDNAVIQQIEQIDQQLGSLGDGLYWLQALLNHCNPLQPLQQGELWEMQQQVDLALKRLRESQQTVRRLTRTIK